MPDAAGTESGCVWRRVGAGRKSRRRRAAWIESLVAPPTRSWRIGRASGHGPRRKLRVQTDPMVPGSFQPVRSGCAGSFLPVWRVFTGASDIVPALMKGWVMVPPFVVRALSQ